MLQNEQLLHLLVTPYQNRKLPVYRWYNFNHSFSRDLVLDLIDEFNFSKEARILDPFCGTGTTLLAAKEKGTSSLGLDILPLSIFVSNAKLQRYSTSFLREEMGDLFSRLEENNNVQLKYRGEDILTRVFHPAILHQIFAVSDWIGKQRYQQSRYFFLTALLATLDKVACARKDGGFLRLLPNKKIPDFKETLTNKINKMFEDLAFINNLPPADSKALLGDARKMPFPDRTFNGVITSPPYPNRHDYTRVYALELMIGFLDSESALKALRYRTLCSHVEARRVFYALGYRKSGKLRKVLEQLQHTQLPNTQVIKMLDGYFEDMFLVISEVRRVLKSGGFAAFVIGDVHYGGVLIPVEEILAEMGERAGLRFTKSITARFRGNSPQQMGKFGRSPTKESILIWEKM